MSFLNFVFVLLAKIGARSQFLRTKKIAISDSLDVLNDYSANLYITEKLRENKPFMVARFGHGEYECVRNYLELEYFKKQNIVRKLKLAFDGFGFQWKNNVKNVLFKNAGFFPVSDSMLDDYCRLTLRDASEIDLIGVWGNLKNESGFYKSYCSKAQLTELKNLEPYYHQNPWSLALKGKKVLVIHPFEESIKANFENRKLIFPAGILPDFQLKTLKAVQSIADNKGQFNNWFEALDYMCERIDEIDYDVAIIGAGAYGLSLAAHVKRSGKQAIHLGGATQILFGIRGKRWDDMPSISNLYNEHWTRPLAAEVPKGYKKIENGCYW